MKNVPFSVVVALLVAATLGFLVTRQETASGQGNVEERVKALEAGQLALQQQLQVLRAAMQGSPAGQAAAAPQAAPLPATIRIGGAPVLGRAGARLAIVEFSDFECPFCGRYNRETFPQLKADYIDTGKVKYAFRNFPLERIHPRALHAAEAGECANRQGKFWAMHDRLFASQQALADANLLAQAQVMGLDMNVFKQCLMGQALPLIRQDQEEGGRGGVTGTPGFFFGTIGPDGNLRVLRRILGAQPYADFKAAIDALLVSPQVAG